MPKAIYSEWLNLTVWVWLNGTRTGCTSQARALKVATAAPTRPASVGLQKKGDLSHDTLLRRALSSDVEGTGSSLGWLCAAVPSIANTGRAGAAACLTPSSVSHLRSQPVAKPVGFSSSLLQRTASIPPAGTLLKAASPNTDSPKILQGHSENRIPQMTAPFFPSEQTINRKSQL